LIDLPKDVSQSVMEWWYPAGVADYDLPGYRPESALDQGAIDRASALIATSSRPVLYVGGGTLKSRASSELLAFAERTRIPVVTTLMARGAFPDSHELHLGMPGMHGHYAAVTALQRADLLIVLGARFDDRVTGLVSAFAPLAKVIHVDVDRAEFNKIRHADVAILSTVGAALAAIDASGATPRSLGPWWSEINEWRADYPLAYDPPPAAGPLRPQAVIEAIARAADPGTIVTSGVGQHQMWAAQHWKFEEPGTWINSGGAGTMGFGVPAAIGAKVGRPDRTVWCIDGDGCFQMTAQELTTARAEGIPIKVAILNNAYLGMVRQWQEMFYEERYSEVYLSADLPDYVKWAEAMGCLGLRATNPKEMADAIAEANSVNDVPVVIDFRTNADEKVFPMVPSGASNDEIITYQSYRAGR
jgi:acetolactate synthase-1/2/3 large subunit